MATNAIPPSGLLMLRQIAPTRMAAAIGGKFGGNHRCIKKYVLWRTGLQEKDVLIEALP